MRNQNKESKPLKSRQGIFKLVSIFLIPPIIFIILFRDTDLNEFLKLLSTGRPHLFLLVVLLTYTTHFLIVGFKWAKTLQWAGLNVNAKDALLTHIGCVPLSIITPLKSGEAVKALYIQRRYGTTFSSVLSTVIFDRFLNMLVLVIISVVLSSQLVDFEVGLLPVILVVGVLILFLAGRPVEGIKSFLSGRSGGRWESFIKILDGVMLAFTNISVSKKVLLILFACLLHSITIVKVYFAFLMVGVNVPWLMLAAGVPLIVLASNLPISISGLGIREVAFLMVFGAFGGKEQILSAGLAVTMAEGPILAMSGFLLTRRLLNAIKTPGAG